MFAGLPDPLEGGRYHSLAATHVPASSRCARRTEDGEVMAVRHRDLPVDGIQFHPESVLTPDGPALGEELPGGEATMIQEALAQLLDGATSPATRRARS